MTGGVAVHPIRVTSAGSEGLSVYLQSKARHLVRPSLLITNAFGSLNICSDHVDGLPVAQNTGIDTKQQASESSSQPVKSRGNSRPGHRGCQECVRCHIRCSGLPFPCESCKKRGRQAQCIYPSGMYGLRARPCASMKAQSTSRLCPRITKCFRFPDCRGSGYPRSSSRYRPAT